MLGGGELVAAINVAPLTALAGPYHRYVLHRYIALALSSGSPLHILSGVPARTAGGRFNLPGRFLTTYLALDAITAQVEAERITAPFVHVPVAGDLQAVLRLDDPRVTALLHLTPAELHADWRFPNARGLETTTQKLGHAVYASGRIEGVVYPSNVHPGGVCVAVFPERLLRGSSLKVDDPSRVILEQLP
jgi:RES domain-containing protein